MERLAPRGRFPYICSLKKPERREHICGATLIETSWILTAAHCVDSNSKYGGGPNLLIFCDVYDRMEFDEEKSSVPRDVIIHPDWNGRVEDGNDIALIQLENEAPYITPRKAVPKKKIPVGQMVSIIGWGRRGGRDPSLKLQIASNLRYVTWQTCNREEWWNGTIKECMCCAISNIAHQDARQGDSGGPLLLVDEFSGSVKKGFARYDVLVGITSFGTESCDGTITGVYTSVSYFGLWIENTIKEKEGQSTEGKTKPPETRPAIKTKASPSITTPQTPPIEEPKASPSTTTTQTPPIAERIYGGIAAPRERFPYMCRIQDRATGEHACGSTLIRANWVLTAAHCVDPRYPRSAGVSPIVACDVRLYDYALEKYMRFSTQEVHLPGSWTGNPKNGSDIALIRLYKVTVPIDTPKLNRNKEDEKGSEDYSILGWAKILKRRDSGPLLLASEVPYLETKSCNAKKWVKGLIKDSMLCTYSDSQFPCKGDEGGPLLKPNRRDGQIDSGKPTNDFLFRIISIVPPKCRPGYPGVYTSVAYFVPWIECVTQGKEDCDQIQLSTKQASGPKTRSATDVDSRFLSDEETIRKKETPLQVIADQEVFEEVVRAIRNNELAIVERAILRGININSRFGADKNSLLIEAAKHGSEQVVKLLIAHGADVNIANSDGYTALHYASSRGEISIVKILIDAGVTKLLVSEDRKTPLEMICLDEDRSCSDEETKELQRLLKQDDLQFRYT